VDSLVTFKTLQEARTPDSKETEPPSVSQKKPLKSIPAKHKHLSFDAPTSIFDDGKGAYVVANETFGFTYLHDVSFGVLRVEY
jgi:hypothetical protein